jgi:hypothetical protein
MNDDLVMKIQSCLAGNKTEDYKATRRIPTHSCMTYIQKVTS